MAKDFRLETDSMGDVQIPAHRYWGAQTERSRKNFQIGSDIEEGRESEKMPLALIHALALQKRCAAFTNLELGLLAPDLAQAIVQAAEEIMTGKWDEEFPLVIWQTGSGTQTNMNANEVIANRANEILGFSLSGNQEIKKPIHANDHVNLSQSSNDSIPTAMHMAALLEVQRKLLPALRHFQGEIEKKVEQFKSLIKVGRTHLQDATPITLGQEFSGYARQIELGIQRLQDCLVRLYPLAQGGTAVGTGLNCPKEFDVLFAKQVADATGFPFVTAENKFEALASHDALVELSGVLNVLAVSCMKIAGDIRWLGSGPRCGLRELHLPENEPGSSIMPGKVNPTQAEAMTMVACQVMGNHVTITIAGSQGHFELNVFKPVIIANVLRSIRLLADACRSFTDNCLKDITANEEHLAQNVAKSLMLATVLNPVIGYDKAAKVVKKALSEDVSLEEATVSLGYLSVNEFKKYVQVEKMI